MFHSQRNEYIYWRFCDDGKTKRKRLHSFSLDPGGTAHMHQRAQSSRDIPAREGEGQSQSWRGRPEDGPKRVSTLHSRWRAGVLCNGVVTPRQQLIRPDECRRRGSGPKAGARRVGEYSCTIATNPRSPTRPGRYHFKADVLFIHGTASSGRSRVIRRGDGRPVPRCIHTPLRLPADLLV